MFGWLRKGEIRTGLDVGSHCVKLLQVGFHAGKAREIVKAAAFPAPLDPGLAASLVKLNPVVHWRPSWINTKRLQLPGDFGAALSDGLRYECQRFLPYDPADAVLSWLHLGGLEYWLALAPIELVREIKGHFQGPLQLELAPEFALWRLLTSQAIVDAGHQFTKISRPGVTLWRPSEEDTDEVIRMFRVVAEADNPLWVGGKIPEGAHALDVAAALGLPAGSLGPEFGVAAGLLLPAVGPERLSL